MMQQTQHGGAMAGIGSQQSQQAQQDQQQQQQSQQQSQQQQQSQGQQTQQQQTQQSQTQQTQQQTAQQQQQQQQTAQQQQQQQQQQQEVKLDSISRVKNHYGQMKDALMEALSCVATNVGNNNQVDQGNRNAGEIQHAKFEESIEKFYTLCDQMELNLRTAIDSQLQAKASQLNTPNSINIPPVEVQKYVHYLATVRNQVVFAKDIHTALVDAARMTTTSAMTTMDNAN